VITKSIKIFLFKELLLEKIAKSIELKGKKQLKKFFLSRKKYSYSYSDLKYFLLFQRDRGTIHKKIIPEYQNMEQVNKDINNCYF